MRIAKENASREGAAYIAFLGIFWGLMYSLDEILFQVWRNTGDLQRGIVVRELLPLAFLAFSIFVATRIGQTTYIGLALITLVGIPGWMMVRLYVDASQTADSFEINFSYGALAPSIISCVMLFAINQLTSHSSSPTRGGTADAAP